MRGSVDPPLPGIVFRARFDPHPSGSSLVETIPERNPQIIFLPCRRSRCIACCSPPCFSPSDGSRNPGSATDRGLRRSRGKCRLTGASISPHRSTPPKRFWPAGLFSNTTPRAMPFFRGKKRTRMDFLLAVEEPTAAALPFPFTDVTYWWEVDLQSGSALVSAAQTFFYHRRPVCVERVAPE